MPGTSLKPYDPLFAAAQRARNPVAAAGKGVGAGGFKAPWFDPLVPVAHGAGEVALPALTGAGIAGALAKDEDRTDAMALAGGFGALIGIPAGVMRGQAVREGRKHVRTGLEQGATFGGDPVWDFASRAHPHAPDAETAANLRDYAAHTNVDDFPTISSLWTRSNAKARSEHAFRNALKTPPVSQDNNAYIAELKKEYPNLTDRQIAAKLHPDQRGTTEAPTEGLDAAYRDLISRGRGRSPSGDPYRDIAHNIHNNSRESAKNFLKSWKGDVPTELQSYRKY